METCTLASKLEGVNAVDDTCKEMKEVEGDNGNSGMTVKIKLRRGELEFLMSQLKDKRSGRNSIEEILNQISLQRKMEEDQAVVWKPSLDCIMEIPEVQGFDS